MTGFPYYLTFGCSILFMFGGSLYFGEQEKNFAMGLSIIAGTFGMVFAHLEKFENFKGAGFEAKLRPQEPPIQQSPDLAELAAEEEAYYASNEEFNRLLDEEHNLNGLSYSRALFNQDQTKYKVQLGDYESDQELMQQEQELDF